MDIREVQRIRLTFTGVLNGNREQANVEAIPNDKLLEFLPYANNCSYPVWDAVREEVTKRNIELGLKEK